MTFLYRFLVNAIRLILFLWNLFKSKRLRGLADPSYAMMTEIFMIDSILSIHIIRANTPGENLFPEEPYNCLDKISAATWHWIV